jgi:type III secretion protein U
VSQQKTELPSQNKLRDSRKKGDVAYSRDFSQTALITALLSYTVFNGHAIFQSLGELLLIPAELVGADFGVALKLAASHALRQTIGIIWPYVAIVLGVGMFAEFIQIGFVLAFEKLKPSGKKLNVVANAKNLVSAKNLVDTLKAVLKILCFSVFLFFIVEDALVPLAYAPNGGMPVLLALVASSFQDVLLCTVLLCLALSVFDLIWQRWQRRRRLMMTKQEVTREHKEMEGSPEIKQTRKGLHREMINGGPAAMVRKSSVLVVNPTHIAIALFYEPETTPLPVVLAKGKDELALMMIAEARDAGVPVMQDIPLARALMSTANLEAYIPAELAEPVAMVLRMVRKFAMRPDEARSHRLS